MATGSPRFDLPGITSYFGGKGAHATVRRIINILPPHDIYIEPFLGSGRVLRHKRPAQKGSFGMELDPVVCAKWWEFAPRDVHVLQVDALEHMERLICTLMDAGAQPERILVYCDPPYLMHTRRSVAMVYHREWQDEDHARFLLLALRLRCRVVISHLPCMEYSTALATWSTFTYGNVTRHGVQTEQLWYNYAASEDLHEYTFIGENFRERERIRRQLTILRRRFEALPPAARIAALGMLQQHNTCDEVPENRGAIAEDARIEQRQHTDDGQP